MVAWRRQGQVLFRARRLDARRSGDAQARPHVERSCDRSDRRRRGRLRDRRVRRRQRLRQIRRSAGPPADLSGVEGETMDFSTLRLERQGAVEILSLNRPDALNAMSPEMISELSVYFGGLLARLDVRVVLLRGEGRMFSA